MFDIFDAGDVFDSRDVIERQEELEGIALSEMTADERDELNTLLAFVKEGEVFDDWHYGVTFVADDYFTQYAQGLASDIGVIKSDAEWPYRHIDWDAAADELQADYTDVQVNGHTYWAR